MVSSRPTITSSTQHSTYTSFRYLTLLSTSNLDPHSRRSNWPLTSSHAVLISIPLHLINIPSTFHKSKANENSQHHHSKAAQTPHPHYHSDKPTASWSGSRGYEVGGRLCLLSVRRIENAARRGVHDFQSPEYWEHSLQHAPTGPMGQ